MEMDRPSVAFAHFLDSMVIEEGLSTAYIDGGGIESGTLDMVCSLCKMSVCEVEERDTLRVLFNTALAHTC